MGRRAVSSFQWVGSMGDAQAKMTVSAHVPPSACRLPRYASCKVLPHHTAGDSPFFLRRTAAAPPSRPSPPSLLSCPSRRLIRTASLLRCSQNPSSCFTSLRFVSSLPFASSFSSASSSSFPSDPFALRRSPSSSANSVRLSLSSFSSPRSPSCSSSVVSSAVSGPFLPLSFPSASSLFAGQSLPSSFASSSDKIPLGFFSAPHFNQKRAVARLKSHRYGGVVALKTRAPKSPWYIEAEKEFLGERAQVTCA